MVGVGWLSGALGFRSRGCGYFGRSQSRGFEIGGLWDLGWELECKVEGLLI